LCTSFCALRKTTGAEPPPRALYNFTGSFILLAQRNSDRNVNEEGQYEYIKNKVTCYEREHRVPYRVVF
jgi:hypothetical protein